jgi:hypothetical protein
MFWGKATLEVLLEYLETGVAAEVTTHVCRALLAFARAADAAGKRTEFLARFCNTDGESVIANVGNTCGANNTGQALAANLIEWCHGGDQFGSHRFNTASTPTSCMETKQSDFDAPR